LLNRATLLDTLRTSTKSDRLRDQLAGLQAPPLTIDQVDEITRVGAAKHERYFPTVIIESKREKEIKATISSKKAGGLPLSSTLLIVAMFLLLAPLALASPSFGSAVDLRSMLPRRDGKGYDDPSSGGGSMVTVS
jgi:hypothetical protein